jgi:hypothetical protein
MHYYKRTSHHQVDAVVEGAGQRGVSYLPSLEGWDYKNITPVVRYISSPVASYFGKLKAQDTRSPC